jgi:NifU-like protein involved in Fe-S cluster formation
MVITESTPENRLPTCAFESNGCGCCISTASLEVVTGKTFYRNFRYFRQLKNMVKHCQSGTDNLFHRFTLTGDERNFGDKESGKFEKSFPRSET